MFPVIVHLDFGCLLYPVIDLKCPESSVQLVTFLNLIKPWQVTSGTIEEKIFQRQLTKQGLGGGILDPERSGASQQFHFSKGTMFL
jgi:hypothetical protein